MSDEQEVGSGTAPEGLAKLASLNGDSLIFGVGCLYFGVKAKEIDGWEERVTEALNHLPRVSDIDVSADMSNGYRSIEQDTFPISGYVSFKIEIPSPLQRQLVRVISDRHESYSIQAYRVFMLYEYYGPVAFVVADDPSATILNSAESVIIIREYFKKELSGGRGGAEFGFVGPAPFHGDFSIELHEQDELVLLERTPSRGYDEFVFSCSASDFTSAAEAAEHVFSEISDELTFFYYLKVRRNNRMYAAEEVQALTGNLVRIFEENGVRARARRLFTTNSKMRYLALKALTAEYDAQVNAAADARNKDEIYASDVNPYFSREIEDVITEDFSSVLSGAKDVASLLSEVRARQVEITSLFMSAVAGGVAGALISLLVH